MTTLYQRRVAAEEQQQRVVEHPSPLYVQACPGAGKTRVIVDRHLSGKRTANRRGRAVLSFTHVACDEVTRRCRNAGQPELTSFPNYVGTIDTFLWRYLVRPFLSPDRLWHRIDSWDRVDATIEINHHTLRLSDFQWARDPGATECRAQLQPKTRNIRAYKALSTKGLLEQAARYAVQKRNQLARQGYITGHEIRIRALRALQENRIQATTILSSRFDEIVIDEAQDCSALDLAILNELRNAGLALVFVCDPDQAIYEFRGALPDNVRAFGDSLGTRIDLVGNWRSSPAICGLAATLRPTKPARPLDDPVGPHHDEPTGILLILTDGSQPDQALVAFNTHADAMGIAPERRLVLAHAAAKLPSTTRTAASAPPSNYSARVAWAATITKSKAYSTQLRETAYEILQRALLRYWYADTVGGQ